MSFTFNWPRFSDQFHYDAIQMLNTALNKGNKPPIIADKIEVVELEMGSQPPELEIRDIGDLTMDQFRGIFRMTYTGDAHLVLKTKVQANPLNHKQPDIHLMAGSRGMLAAKHPLVVPMLLRLSHFRLSSYVVLVVSKQKGITLVFKTDPLQHVDINSTFDSIAVIQNFIQREIEGQLRQMFREDLPGIIHRLSQQWVKAKVEAPYLSTTQHLHHKNSLSSVASYRSRPLSTSTGRPTTPPLQKPPTPPEPSPSSHPDLENFDPTYGLRPEGLPTKSVFKSFSSLFTPNKGLADLAEEIDDKSSTGLNSEFSEYDDEEQLDSFDFVDWGDDSPAVERQETSTTTTPEYETIPAVGGGTITRPRVFHSQSQVGLSRSISSLNPSHPPPPSSNTSSRRHTSLSASHPNIHLHMNSSASSTAGVPLRTAPVPGSYTQRPGMYPRTHRNTAGSFILGRPRTPDSIDSPPTSRSSSGLSTSASAAPFSRRLTGLSYPYSRASSLASEINASGVKQNESSSPLYMQRGLGQRRMSSASDATVLSGISHRTATTAAGRAYFELPPNYEYEYEHHFTEHPYPYIQDAEHRIQRDRDHMRVQRAPVSSSVKSSSLTVSPLLEPPLSPTHSGSVSLSPSISVSASTPASPSKQYHPRPPLNTHTNFHSTTNTQNQPQVVPAFRPAHKIVLRPSSGSSSIHQLSTLSTSNHTLSPYTRDLSHFTVRSVPPRTHSVGIVGVGASYGFGVHSANVGGSGSAGGPNGDRGHIKAKRKRIYKLGGKGAGVAVAAAEAKAKAEEASSRRRPERNSAYGEDEFDVSDMDRYFTHDDDDHLHTGTNTDEPRTL
ncbi:Mitochondrial distribution and morphology protein 34 [Psilocybe cubensis]|uniref:Mitochondrial distribution and morphology protein 34 n=2 Tax=Psilocybe cubensis TaxID=181762 RepID=A0A8H7XZW2_PSICU|nr:Mitochondrial distribution and morphology protein 34 [Psilocybe cubensis]KAH9482361.1 Mitochondrial distribution and morphology protein 34 [Psilocybe cubensis]